MAIQTVNPATGEVVEKPSRRPPPAEARSRGAAGAQAAFHEWRAVPVAERAAPMREAARILRARKEEFARTMTVEMGKPITQGEAEAEKCAWTCDYYADARRRDAREWTLARPTRCGAMSAIDPLGVVLAIMPVELPLLAGVPLRGARRSWPGMPPSSSTPRTCRAARSTSRRCSSRPASRAISSAPCSSSPRR